MYFKLKKKKYERKTVKGKIIASKISGFNSNKVIFYIECNNIKKRYITLLKDIDEAKNYYLNYKPGMQVMVIYLDVFYPLILKIKRIY